MDVYVTTLSQYTPEEVQTNTQKFFDEIYGITSRHFKSEHSEHFFRTYTRRHSDFRLFNAGIRTMVRGDKTIQREVIESQKFIRRHPDITKEYETFHIPKKTGGLRTICAPSEALKNRQREINHWLLTTVKVLPHDCAFAYVQHRTGKDALIRHQRNSSRWFLKLDLKDFFPSLTKEFVLDQLMKNGAMNRHQPDREYYNRNLDRWTKLLEPCFLENALPQGAVTSPLLSNLAMLPIDYKISSTLFNLNNRRFIYTRYADDILISCREKFTPIEIISIINAVLDPTPLRIKHEKTRFGSSAGSNWNLGIMYNDQCNLTIGHRRKARFRSMLFAFLKDNAAGRPWDIENTRKLDGERAWFASIEPEWMEKTIRSYEQEYSDLNFRAIVKNILNPR